LGNKQYRILLVDDDYLNQRMMGLVLSGGGFSCDAAFNGAEAIDAIQSQHFDLILMDLQMPIMDGYEATRRIRAWESGNSHIPIVALTAMVFDDEVQDCLDAGMDDCVVKPFDTARLLQLIDSHIENSIKSTFAIDIHGMKLEEKNSLLNIQAAISRFGNDIETYKEFLADFLQTLPHRIEEFHLMYNSRNLQSLSAKAHNLKGVAANMGAMQLSASASKLNRSSKIGELSSIEESLDECSKSVSALQDNAMIIISKYPQN
jgi:two-component system sensor histidine kinase/response regulator